MKRLFCAIDLPERIIDDICATYQAIPGARWIREEQLHITLRFFGDVPADRERDLTAALTRVPQTPFPLSLSGVGFFPPRGEARVLWVGIRDSEPLKRLHTLIEQASVRSRFATEHRRFAPHITVARLNQAHRERVATYIVSNSLFSTESFEVTAFHLYASHLGKEGARYTREVTFSLT